MAVQISKKRKFVADGIFKTELNEFLTWELAEDGYSGVEVVELYAEKVAESLPYKLLGGLAVRRACYSVLRYLMESWTKGCEVVVSGKLRGQRAKSMKFVDGLMIHSGDPVNYNVDTAVCHVLLRQGVLGIKVKIMLPWDPTGKTGPKKPLPDHMSILEPKDEILLTTPISEQKGGKPEPPAMPQPVPTA
uniref:40S ribosomal protein S3 n=1 Tax=Rhinopithecus roxellana TaxID=61622 RepID=A0A2K6QUM3_RHIRO